MDAFVPEIFLDTQAGVSEEEAVVVAKDLWQEQFNLNSAKIIDVNLYVFNKGIIRNIPDQTKQLVWRVELYNSTPAEHEFYFIDAKTGELVYQLTGVKDAINRQMYDCSLGSWCYLDTAWLGYTYGRSEGQPARGANPLYFNTDVDDLYSITNDIHNYYLSTFGLDGANGLGGLGDGSTNNYGVTDGYVYIDSLGLYSCPNAFFDGFSINFCYGLVTSDVVGHEYGHGVLEFAVPDIDYESEGGAVHEAYADVAGEGVEFYRTGNSDWLNGGDVTLVSLSYRNMVDPPSNSDGLGPNPDTFYSSNMHCTSEDNYGVHHNSTVISHAAYLMAMGGSENTCTITGIGRAKQEQIFYRAISQYITSSVTFNDLYNALLYSCDDLYSDSDCNEVEKALKSVELNQAGLCNDPDMSEKTDPGCSEVETSPTISSVSSDKADGSYKAGETIDIDITFSKAVTSTGNVTVTLETGDTDRTCTFTVSNATTGSCNYIVQAGDNSSDLNVSSITGTISDQYGNPLTNFTPSSNLADNKAIVVDTGDPTGSMTINSDGVYTMNQEVTLTLSASDSVSGVAQMRFANDSTSNWQSWETYNSSKTWTLTAGEGVRAVYAQFKDSAGNTSAEYNDAIIRDSVAPTTSISPTPGQVAAGTQVSLSTNETAAIYFTTDNSVPGTGSNQYSSPIVINNATIIKYLAIDQVGNQETYQTAKYYTQEPASIITAAGPGGGPHIRAFDYQGNAQADPNNLFAFSQSFRGGVHVAAGDIDGDGVDEIVAGIGPGEEPWVRVFEKNGSLISEFLAYAENIKGGVYIACGDLNGDGRDEIITGVPEGFGPHVRVFDGRDGSITITAGFFAYGKNVRTGIRVAAGDLDGNGTDEIITGTGYGAGTHVRTFTGTGQAVFTPGFFVYGETDRTGIKVAAGDIDGDGEAEIITGSGYSRAPEIRTYDRYGNQLSSFAPYASNYRLGVKIAAGDIDNDGFDEIITGTEEGGGPQVRIFDMNGTFVDDFFAYDTRFRGGVDVAVGNLDN